MVDVCKSCSRSMRIQARGMCTRCYRHQLFVENPTYAANYRAQATEAKRQRRLADETWREKERARDRNRNLTRSYSGNCSLCQAEGCVAKGLCRRCYNRVRMQELRAANPEIGKPSAKQLERLRRNAETIRAAKGSPCSDCGGSFPPECMDLDHVRGEKLFNLSNSGSRSHAAVLEELAKCDVVCANCHRIRTRTRAKARGRNGMV